MATHFIADLHLRDADDTNATQLISYLERSARSADALYVLGDLFDVWIGDDGSLGRHRRVIAAFAALVDAGVPVYFMRGNRDFAVGKAFVSASRMQIVDDPLVVDLDGTPTLLTHGDMLCTDDVAHQAFRARYTDARWRARMLRIPLPLRWLIALWARRKSAAGKVTKASHIMDVNAQAVRDTMRAYGVRRLVHGHTHRPADHVFDLDGQTAERIVLADWRADRTQFLCLDESGTTRYSISAGPVPLNS